VENGGSGGLNRVDQSKLVDLLEGLTRFVVAWGLGRSS
jgi:hypothetical protein